MGVWFSNFWLVYLFLTSLCSTRSAQSLDIVICALYLDESNALLRSFCCVGTIWWHMSLVRVV